MKDRERGMRGRKRERTECQLSTAATRELKTFLKTVFHFMADHPLLSQSKEFQAGLEQPGTGLGQGSSSRFNRTWSIRTRNKGFKLKGSRFGRDIKQEFL